ncbi:uncharacterized protein [Diadema setosum]|uniref:uncharacterized protein isoform X1 n=1 Tax=Diadema setosum TaxID=31175 RepID=UPI003B3B6EA1
MVEMITEPPAYPGGNIQKSGDSNWNTIPIITVNGPRDSEESKDKLVKLPKLPSERFRYTLFHELKQNELRGSELHCPRVRKGPEIKEKVFTKVTDDQGKTIHHGKMGLQRKDHQKKMEDWENCVHANLSFQDMHHDYQKESLHRILKRLIRAETVQARDNNITDLSDVSLNCCKHLNLSKNYITSFKKLPKSPVLEVLNLSDNSINSYEGLTALRKTRLQCLDLRRNPICFMENYRQRIFQALPNLTVLDDVRRLPSDSADGLPPAEGSCVIL